MSQKTLETLWNSIRWLLILVALVPLLYVSGMYYPFVVPKVVYFRTLVEFSVALLVIYAIYRRNDINFKILKNKVTWLPAVFLGVSYVSSYFGVDFYHSFWSSFERMDGLFTLTHMVAYFYLLLFVFREKDWKLFFTANAIIGFLVALYAVGQHFGFAWFLDKADPRVKGTIGNPAFLASYLAITAFFVFDFARKAKTTSVKYWWYFALFIHALAIIWSQTRGIFVAIFVATAGLLALFLVTAREKKLKTWAIGGIIAIIVSSALVYTYRQEVALANIPMLSRVASISTSDSTTQSRLFVWGKALNASLERPILGYGNENFGYVYNKFYDPQKIGEEWFDRSHNVYIDELIHGGVIGLGIYLAILAFMFYALWQYRTKDQEKALLFGTLLLVYTIQNFFVFDTINSSFLFWALFAFIIYLKISEEEGSGIKKEGSPREVLVITKVALAVFAGGLVISGYWTNVLPVRANIDLSEGYMYQIADIKRSATALNRGLSYGTFGDLGYGYQVYDMYKNKLEYGKISQKDLKESYDFSEKFLRSLIKKYPWDTRLYIYWGHVVEGRPKDTPYDEKKLVGMMEKAMELSPMRPQAYYILANVSLNKLAGSTPAEKEKLNAQALEILKRYADLVPHYAEAQFIVTGVAVKAGKKALAEEYFKRGDQSYTQDYGTAKRAVTYLILTNDYKRAEKYFKDISAMDPKNLDAMVDLAKIYYMNGKIDEAVDTLNKVNELDPHFLEKEPDLTNKILNSYQR